MQQAWETIWDRSNKPRTEAATEQAEERKRDRGRCSVGRWAKRHLSRARACRGTQKKRGTTIDIRGTAKVETDPHTGNRTEKRRRSRRQIRAQGTKTISGERKATKARMRMHFHSRDNSGMPRIWQTSFLPYHVTKRNSSNDKYN